MDINYKITDCVHCGKHEVIGLTGIYGLVKLTDELKSTDEVLPVVVTVCKSCGQINLIHANAKEAEKE